jgi:hypothetical protein
MQRVPAHEPAGSALARPRLRVPLAGGHELPSTLAAVEFAYTGQLPAGWDMQQLLELYRQAQYLQVAGCAESCVQRLAELLQAIGSAARGATAPNVADSAAQTLAGHAFCNPTLWALLEGSPALLAALQTAKPLLVQHFGDALAVLNTPALREQFLQLSMAGVAALLETDDLGTDSESSVLLLLGTWVQANYSRTTAEERSQLCGLVRLAQLSKPYLECVLPALAADSERLPDQQAGWFAISSQEASHIRGLQGSTGTERKRRQEAWTDVCGAPKHPAWYSQQVRRQCLPAEGRRVEWSISEEELRSKLAGLQEGQTTDSYATTQLYAAGFSWQPYVQYKHGNSSAGLFLYCDLPSDDSPSGSTVAAACKACVVPMSARLSVSRYVIGNGARGEDVVERFSPTVDFCAVGWGWGFPSLLPRQRPLLPAGAAGPLSLERWAAWLKDGKLSGSLTWLPA